MVPKPVFCPPCCPRFRSVELVADLLQRESSRWTETATQLSGYGDGAKPLVAPPVFAEIRPAGASVCGVTAVPEQEADKLKRVQGEGAGPGRAVCGTG